ncbi:hypothetical protein EVAR_100066_1 [Eumeta japonica]|uniref:Uncharacterized protein n=1 Tax=Eumeta variegata TaxID=151549 RepID=A0A4C2A1Z6_EUMVA|nr:hypothetical protein EVAR_100066_1 [Eumeta japonica]
MALRNRRPYSSTQGTWSNLGVSSGLTPVSLWALLEWTFISPVLSLAWSSPRSKLWISWESSSKTYEALQTQVNVHKPIKTSWRASKVSSRYSRSWKLRSRVNDRDLPGLQRRTPPPRTNDVTTGTNTEMELETDADTESTAQDNREVRRRKGIRSPEDGTVRTTKKLRDFGPSPQPKTTIQKTEKKQ